MPAKRRCLIVGLDGFDVDVLINLYTFYKASGMSVRVSRRPANTDILVLCRPNMREIFSNVKASECHVYDYVGTNPIDLNAVFPRVENFILIRPKLSSEDCEVSNIRCTEAMPPVMTDVWLSGPQPSRAIDVGHIGHFKKGSENDKYGLRLINAISEGRVEVWGSGWDGVIDSEKAIIHPSTSVYESQHLYRNTNLSVGLMYDFQRSQTLSGRMWQAPLNGCLLESEPVDLAVQVPGVVCGDDYLLGTGIPKQVSESDIKDEAREYWNRVTANLASFLGVRLMHVKLASFYGRRLLFAHHLKRGWSPF
tara:strand:- start:2783 stop:3706 length:924 start_codon:yes stop_codon:yes gene_type:complete